MVQAITAGGLGALSAGVSALSNQQRREVSRPQLPTATPFIAQAKDKKIAKLAKDNARDERIMYLLAQPEVLGSIITIAGIYASQKIRFSDNDATNELIQGTATSTSVLMGLGHAGVGDLTTAIVAGLAGVASVLSGVNMGDVLPDFGSLPGLTPTQNEILQKSLIGWALGMFPGTSLFGTLWNVAT